MGSGYNFSKVTQDIVDLASLCSKNDRIDPELYTRYDVKRGLRDINGKGVLAGLTEISEIISSKTIDGESVPCEGELYYRGYNINDLVSGFTQDKRFGFEEITYLLLFGELPDKSDLKKFNKILADYRQLPTTFVRDIIMKSPSNDIMNGLARGVLTLYSYDDMPNDTSIPNVLRQSLELISVFPLIAVYSYQAKTYYHDGGSFFIHQPVPEYSTAENILHMLRPDSSFTPLEAHILDLALVLHAEHGGGNNSTFTTHVVTSSGTDTYSAIAAALSSLKGPKHGGANIK
ncbi:MAG: citrate synthase, partial [Oscillospiraceae bacterium]|nr:citrate synthase [Oscillospiraceae bacterium]